MSVQMATSMWIMPEILKMLSMLQAYSEDVADSKKIPSWSYLLYWWLWKHLDKETELLINSYVHVNHLITPAFMVFLSDLHGKQTSAGLSRIAPAKLVLSLPQQ